MAHTAIEGSWISGRAIAKYDTKTKTATVKISAVGPSPNPSPLVFIGRLM